MFICGMIDLGERVCLSQHIQSSLFELPEIILIQQLPEQIPRILRNQPIILFSIQKQIMLPTNLVHNLLNQPPVHFIHGQPNHANLFHTKLLRSL